MEKEIVIKSEVLAGLLVCDIVIKENDKEVFKITFNSQTENDLNCMFEFLKEELRKCK